MSDLRLTALLEAHRLTTPVQCACGWRETDGDPGDTTRWASHVTGVLADRDAAGVEARASALEAVADDLTWVRPEVCPCPSPENCCGSEESCDAMQPIRTAIDADGLRKRAAALRALSPPDEAAAVGTTGDGETRNGDSGASTGVLSEFQGSRGPVDDEETT